MSPPGAIICALVDVANRTNARTEDGPRFRVVEVVEQGGDSVVTILNRDTGAAFEFTCRVRRRPLGTQS